MNASKTLLISQIFPPQTGGSGRWFYEIYSRLPQDRYVIAAGEHPNQSEHDQKENLQIHRLPLALPAWGLRSWTALKGYFRITRQLRRLIKQEGITEIHCGRCLPEGFMAWLLSWRCRIPYSCYVHGEDVVAAATSRELTWMVRRSLGSSRFVIANSQSTRSILLNQWHLPEEKVRLLHPGCDTRRFVPAAPDPQFREQMGWTGKKVVLTVGRLQRRKGHDMMIRALPTIREKIPEVVYAIVGEGAERPELEKLVEELGVRNEVQFLGEIADEDLIRSYQQCDLFALPNRTDGADIEGFGMVLVEAQACGKPVLAGRSGGTKETMKVPETGRILDCQGPEELAQVIPELLSQPELLSEMGTKGRQWVTEQFDWQALTQKAQEIFKGTPTMKGVA